MSLWKWNDVELEIDMEDVDFQEKYEAAFNAMAEDEKALQQIGTISGFSNAYCAMYFKLFDGIFGEGTAEKLFKGKRNIGKVEDCYDSFIQECSKEVVEINKRRAKRYAKYRPKSK